MAETPPPQKNQLQYAARCRKKLALLIMQTLHGATQPLTEIQLAALSDALMRLAEDLATESVIANVRKSLLDSGLDPSAGFMRAMKDIPV